jgi:hypothetical protein
LAGCPEVLPALQPSRSSAERTLHGISYITDEISFTCDKVEQKQAFSEVLVGAGTPIRPAVGARHGGVEPAADIVCAYRDRNINIFTLVGWLDFPYATVFFEKQHRRFGASKWSWGRRAKLFIEPK